MKLNNLYEISGSALNAQMVRLNTIASNLANISSAGSTPEEAYRPVRPLFSAFYKQTVGENAGAARVQVDDVLEMPPSEKNKRYEPDNPLANQEGYVFYPDINVMQEMADMLSATRSYQSSMEVMVSAKKLQQRLLSLGE
ncbi:MULTISPECIES: flagellar basal body rod protein FlgC [unclassified Endozoicomonas]|uniref:flagellar basal body rod protein FlgC n=1 Tax=unclassified Endozoicomonas TaxID=2644528 RepID=UPI002147E33D|nr:MULTISPECIES: flagellar basal body rod protein FlgC [unclassified Endozoicomonas]